MREQSEWYCDMEAFDWGSWESALSPSNWRTEYRRKTLTRSTGLAVARVALLICDVGAAVFTALQAVQDLFASEWECIALLVCSHGLRMMKRIVGSPSFCLHLANAVFLCFLSSLLNDIFIYEHFPSFRAFRGLVPTRTFKDVQE